MTDDTDWETIQAHLPSDWRELGEGLGLIRERPGHMGTKIHDLGVALRLVLHQVASSSSLRVTTGLAAATGVVAIAAVSLHKWMKKLGPYLTMLLARMVDVAAYAPEKWGGLHIIVADGTTVQRPGSKGTTARVHYALRLADMTPRHIDVTDEHGGETARRFLPEPGEVWLLDRCYSNPAGVAVFHERGDLDRLPNFLPETIHSWICAKLLLQLISARIANASGLPSEAFPPGGRRFTLLPAATDARDGGTRRRRALVHRSHHLGRPAPRAPATSQAT